MPFWHPLIVFMFLLYVHRMFYIIVLYPKRRGDLEPFVTTFRADNYNPIYVRSAY